MRSPRQSVFEFLDQLAIHRHFPLLGGGLAAILYLSVAWYVWEPRSIWSPDEGAKLLQLQSLHIENGALNLDIIYTSQGLDPEFRYALINPVKDVLTVQDGALMLPRLPLFTLLTLPLYRLLGMTGLYVLPALGGGAAVWLSLAFIPMEERRVSMWFLIALGSPVLIYAALFWEHTLATALSLAGAWIIMRADGTRMGSLHTAHWVLAAAFLTLGTYLRLEVALFALGLLAATFLCQPEKRTGLLLVLVIALCFLLPYPFLHRNLFEQQALPLNARHLNLPMAYLGQTGWLAVQDLLIGPYTDEAIDSGWIGAAWSLVAIVAIVLSVISLSWRRVQRWLYVPLAISLLPAAYFLVTPTPYRAAHGLLFTTPWALLGLTRIPELWSQKNQQLRTLILTALFGLGGYTLVMIGFRASSPHGGLEWGARFALLFYPLLALLAAWGKGKLRHETILLSLFLLLGIGFQLRGIATIYQDKKINHALNQSLMDAPEVHVLSDLWWLPVNAAPIYPHKAFFLANDPVRMAEWLRDATDAGFRTVLFVTLNPTLPDQVEPWLEHETLKITAQQNIENLIIFHIMLEPQ